LSEDRRRAGGQPWVGGSHRATRTPGPPGRSGHYHPCAGRSHPQRCCPLNSAT
jgi:hypothetical protein